MTGYKITANNCFKFGWDVNPGEAGEHLQGGEAGVQVSLPGRDQPVAHQVRGAHKQRMRRV